MISVAPLRRKPRPWAAAAALIFALSAVGHAQAPLPSPQEYFGHPMGADRRLVHFDEFLPYYELLAAQSDRVEIETIGKTTLGRDLALVIISTPENLARAERYRSIAAQLDDPRGLTDREVDALVEEGKVILLVTLNIHATEIAASQMGMEWAYDLATGDDSSAARYLKDVIILLVPTVNPDGQSLVTEWYRKQLGTPYEGGPMPWLYHPYAGHDNNRDWFMLNLAETRAVNDITYHKWFPQVLVDEHQMGSTGPRAFVPPYADPVSENVHPLIHRGATLLGANMAMDLEREGKSGVIYGYSFDAYWPGGTRSTPWWKNTVGVLTELASARLGSPIYVDPGELSGGRKGLPDYRPQVNFPNPWPGGWWRQRDIVDYELTLSNSALKTCALHRETFLRNRALMAREAVELGRNEGPFGFVIPPTQHDAGTASKLVDLMRENGVEVFRAPNDCLVGNQVIVGGSFVIPADQPYRAFLVEMLSPQSYPEVRIAPDSDEIYRPYDVTAWTLPYLMGVESFTLESRIPPSCPLEVVAQSAWAGANIVEGTGDHWILSSAENDAYTATLRLLQRGASVRRSTRQFTAGGAEWPAGSFLVQAGRSTLEDALDGLRTQAFASSRPTAAAFAVGDDDPGHFDPEVLWLELKTPRLGIYQSWLASMDEGWTRFVLDSFGFTVAPLHDRVLQSGNLRRSYDAIILPDMSRYQMAHGQWSPADRSRRPSPYGGGLGETGIQSLEAFVKEGGTLITFGNGAEVAMEDLKIPVMDVTSGLSEQEFSTPGALLRVSLDTAHPIAFGMPSEALIYHTNDPVLGTRLPGPGDERSVVGRYVEGDRVLASGWIEGKRHLSRRVASVEVTMGEGRVVIFAFRPQHRAQTHGTYRMIFNALLGSASGTAPS